MIDLPYHTRSLYKRFRLQRNIQICHLLKFLPSSSQGCPNPFNLHTNSQLSWIIIGGMPLKAKKKNRNKVNLPILYHPSLIHKIFGISLSPHNPKQCVISYLSKGLASNEFSKSLDEMVISHMLLGETQAILTY